MGLGNTLKQMLADKGMSIKDLSEKTGIPVNTLYSITKRDSSSIRTDNLRLIAEALDVSPGVLLYGDFKEKRDAIFNPILDVLHSDLSEEEQEEKIKELIGADFEEQIKSLALLKGDSIMESYKWACREIEDTLLLMSREGHEEAVKRIKELSALEAYRKKPFDFS